MSNKFDKSELDVERVKILYKNAGLTLVGLFIAYFTLIIILSDNFSAFSLVVWSMLIAFAMIFRLALIIAFKRGWSAAQINKENALRSERILAITCYPQALAFVSLLFFPFEQDQLISTLFLGLTLVVLMAGSIVSSGTSRITSIGFIVCASVPFIFYCLSEGGSYYFALGFFYTATLIVLSRLALKLNDTICHSITLQMENKLASLQDPLTGLWNRRRLALFASKAIPLLNRTGGDLCVALLDIDDFKLINDTKGHDKGDEILVKISKYLEINSRESDLAVRYGGEEFLIVFPATTLENAAAITERITKDIRSKCGATVSAGVASYESGTSLELLVKQADIGLYQAKEAGKDRVVVNSPVK